MISLHPSSPSTSFWIWTICVQNSIHFGWKLGKFWKSYTTILIAGVEFKGSRQDVEDVEWVCVFSHGVSKTNWILCGENEIE